MYQLRSVSSPASLISVPLLEVAGRSSKNKAELPPSEWATPPRMNTQGNAAFRGIWCSMRANAKWHTSCPTVTQQFNKAICNAVLTCFPSSSARLFSVATSPNGIAKEPVSGIMDTVQHTTAKAPECPTANAAKKLTNAPRKMHGLYTSRGRTRVSKRIAMIARADRSCRPDLNWPPRLKAAIPSLYAIFSGEPSAAVSMPS
mmetsp:Transcript_47010/g.135907  ORF Transcript_47010/g.135907 Transcript_47010/m.135907 type:complete len:202 (+) Transcript_47010:217-822(+)